MRTPQATRALLAAAAKAYVDNPVATRAVEAIRSRLDEPLRVAIAGNIKAGKSTLLNGLLGEEVAATDAGECTMVSTWYVHGSVPSARLYLLDGRTVPLVLRRTDGRLTLDLAGYQPEQVSRMEVTWPSPILSEMTLIDTPGLGSLTTEASQRTVELVTPDAGPGVDALIFLMRHRQASDIEVLQEFHQQSDPTAGSEGYPINVLGVLSRADELGGGGLEALFRSREMADSYAASPEIRTVCQQVLPVAGLVAQGAQTLRQAEFESLRTLARMPKDRRELLMLSAHRFVSVPDPDVSPDARRDLLDRLGLFGIRLAVVLLPNGFDDPMALAAELLRRSGLPALQSAVSSVYAQSADLLKAHTALTRLSKLLLSQPPSDESLARQLEATQLSAHDLRELRLTAKLRAGGLPGLDSTEQERALRLVGANGDSPAERLGVPDGDPHLVRQAAQEELVYWRRLAQEPLTVRTVRDAADILSRTCEGILAITPAAATTAGWSGTGPATDSRSVPR